MSIFQPIRPRKAKPIQVSAKAIVLTGDDVLLLKQSDDTWDLPGGGIRKGESVKSGLRREIREETGLDVAPQALLRTTLTRRRKRREKLILSFLCHADATEQPIQLSPEHIAYTRVPLSDAIWFNMKPHHRNAVLAAAEHRKSRPSNYPPY